MFYNLTRTILHFPLFGYSRPPLIKPIPPKGTPLIRPDFTCTELNSSTQEKPPFHKTTLSLQKVWSYTRVTTEGVVLYEGDYRRCGLIRG